MDNSSWMPRGDIIRYCIHVDVAMVIQPDLGDIIQSYYTPTKAQLCDNHPTCVLVAS